VDAARSGDLGSSMCSPPEAGGRRLIPEAERARERLVGLVGGVKGDLCDRPIVRQDLPGRPLHPQAPHQLQRRLPHHPAEHAVKVERGHACGRRQRLQFQRLVEVASDGVDRALDGLLVERARLRLHALNLPPSGRRCLISVSEMSRCGDSSSITETRGTKTHRVIGYTAKKLSTRKQPAAICLSPWCHADIAAINLEWGLAGKSVIVTGASSGSWGCDRACPGLLGREMRRS
jgi:hypothetical protein